MKDEFLATVSHEMRTPLTAILGWARMLTTDTFDTETTARAMETIERNATAQAQIIDDILDVSRVITGKLQLSIGPTDLAAVVYAAVNSMRPAANAKNLDLVIDLEPGTYRIRGDQNRLQQITWNLLANAVKFTPASGRIVVRLRHIGMDVELAVKDSGQGMSKEFLPFAFDRFRQADSSFTRSHGGLGLGLAIVRHLVELHGGTVEAESEGPGLGSTFRVKLPVAVAVAMPEMGQSVYGYEDPLNARVNGSLAGLHILVVDDEPDTVEMLETVLQRDGATVSKAGSVKEALEAIAKAKPDIIVSDIGMPEHDGYELLRRLRAVEKILGRKIPAIALTAYVRSDDRKLALDRGFNEHVAKPVDPDVLRAAIANAARSWKPDIQIKT
jgi:CheY-like chemotaxis protein